MKLLFTLFFLVTFIGTIMCETSRLIGERDVGVKTEKLTVDAKWRGRGRGPCTRTTPPATNPGNTPSNGFPTARPSTLSSLLPFPPITAPGQTPFPNIDIRDRPLT